MAGTTDSTPLILWEQEKLDPEKWNRARALCGDSPAPADHLRWRAKAYRSKAGTLQVEVRCDVPDGTLLMVVASDGWDYKHEQRVRTTSWGSSTTVGKQVRLSANSSLRFEIHQLQELALVATEAHRLVLLLEEQYRQ